MFLSAPIALEISLYAIVVADVFAAHTVLACRYDYVPLCFIRWFYIDDDDDNVTTVYLHLVRTSLRVFFLFLSCSDLE